jgi:membrane-associated phospholipid phosphatase
MNPPLIVGYFFAAGLLLGRPRSAELAVCMLFAGGMSGLLVQLLKQVIGRARPELWLGPFHHAWPSATSFPSGHTVGAFALASVIFFGAEKRLLRYGSIVLAAGIGCARVVAFRHWPSDVVASALIGTAMGWFFVQTLRRSTSEESEAKVTEAADIPSVS